MSIAWDEQVDVLVVGTGAAGCSAALGALFNGAQKVLVIEKGNKLIGGTTRLAGGGWIWCPNNRFLKKLGVECHHLNTFELLKDLAYPNNSNETIIDDMDLELMRTFSEKWPKVCELLQQEEVLKLQVAEVRSLVEDAPRVESLLWKKNSRTPNFQQLTGISETNIKALSKMMPSYCSEHPLDLCPSGKVLQPSGNTTSKQLVQGIRRFATKCEIRMGTRAVDIVLEGSHCLGAKIMNNETNVMSYVRTNNGVIFGSGGFSRNKQMVQRHLDFSIDGTCSARTNTGDFVKICQMNNIPLSGMNHAWLKQVVLPDKPGEFRNVFFLNGGQFLSMRQNWPTLCLREKFLSRASIPNDK